MFFKPINSNTRYNRNLHIINGSQHFIAVKRREILQQFEQEVHQSSSVKLARSVKIQTSVINISFNEGLKLPASVSIGLSQCEQQLRVVFQKKTRRFCFFSVEVLLSVPILKVIVSFNDDSNHI